MPRNVSSRSLPENTARRRVVVTEDCQIVRRRLRDVAHGRLELRGIGSDANRCFYRSRSCISNFILGFIRGQIGKAVHQFTPVASDGAGGRGAVRRVRHDADGGPAKGIWQTLDEQAKRPGNWPAPLATEGFGEADFQRAGRLLRCSVWPKVAASSPVTMATPCRANRRQHTYLRLQWLRRDRFHRRAIRRPARPPFQSRTSIRRTCARPVRRGF